MLMVVEMPPQDFRGAHLCGPVSSDGLLWLPTLLSVLHLAFWKRDTLFSSDGEAGVLFYAMTSLHTEGSVLWVSERKLEVYSEGQ